MCKKILAILVTMFNISIADAQVRSYINTLNSPEVKAAVEKVIQELDRQPYELKINLFSSLGFSELITVEMSFYEKTCKMTVEEKLEGNEFKIRIYLPMICKDKQPTSP